MSVRLRRSMLIVLALVPALATGAPRTKKKPKKPSRPPATKPTTDIEPPQPSPDQPPPSPASDAKVTPAPTPTGSPTPTVPPSGPPAPIGGGAGGAGAGSGMGGGSGVATDAAAPASQPASADPDVDTLRQEYLSLRDELFKSRARANTVASQLYSTRVQIKLTYTTARYYNPAKASIRLDGATIYENAGGGIAADDGIRFDGYVAPGRHLVTFHVEATGKDDDSFTSVTENQIVVKAVGGKDLLVVAKAHDGGDIAYEWKRKERGTYGLGVDVIVKTVPRAQEAKK